MSIAMKSKDQLTIEDIIHSPVACGYLLSYCEQSFCAENLQFWIAIDQFKDKCKNFSFEKDSDVALCGSLMGDIWEEFLSQNSSTEVSLPSQDRKATIDRMEKVKEFKDQVFEVALQDPMKTLRKDIKPRFLNSKQFTEYQNREKEALSEKDVKVKKPVASLLDFDFPDNKDSFTIEEIVNDKHLYVAMVSFLEKKYCSEDLVCLRGICYYQEAVEDKDKTAMADRAWTVYRNFIVDNAPLAISCTVSIRKKIMHSLANPTADIFDEIRTITCNTLKQQQNQFQDSQEFADTLTTMRELKNKRHSTTSRFKMFGRK